VRDEHSVGPVDGLVIGLVQCFSLIPGVSRSGATISAGIMRGINRVTATRLSFFLAIPALTAAGLFQAVQEKDGLVALGLGPVAVGLVVAFAVALASIAWLLRFVATNTLMAFVWYRVVLGVLLAALLGAGVISAT
jgi:undecaprenyl-diphosphatase